MTHGRSATLRALLPAACALALALATGCLTRSVKEVVYQQDQTTVTLRSEKKGGTTLSKGYGHPLVISPARTAHILSRVEQRGTGDDNQRRAVVPLDLLYPLAEGIAKALGKATPDQEVVVMAVEHGKRWGIFDRYYLTSFILFARDDLLYIQVARSRWEIPRNLQTDLPEPRLDQQEMSFRLLPSEAMVLAGAQTVAVTWRAPIFQRATRTRITPTGKVVRREILMETPEDAPDPPLATDVLPGNLAPDTLRKLADLEDSKTRGEVTQAEYAAQREAILREDPSYSAE
jgi:hypothetical protein